MSILYELIQSEYKTEYISEYTKMKELMEKKNILFQKSIQKLFLKSDFQLFLKEKKKRF